jgi:hypothetical protein
MFPFGTGISPCADGSLLIRSALADKLPEARVRAAFNDEISDGPAGINVAAANGRSLTAASSSGIYVPRRKGRPGHRQPHYRRAAALAATRGVRSSEFFSASPRPPGVGPAHKLFARMQRLVTRAAGTASGSSGARRQDLLMPLMIVRPACPNASASSCKLNLCWPTRRRSSCTSLASSSAVPIFAHRASTL